MTLKGRTGLITGGCQNFGLEMTISLLEAGADLIITSRNEAKVKETAVTLNKKYGRRVYGLEMDLRDEDSIIRLFSFAKETFGRLDVLVNNAGGHSPQATGLLESETLDAWRETIDLNLTGTFLMLREYAKLMIKHRRGAIINIASIAALVGRDRRIYPDGKMKPQSVFYAAVKAGILGLTLDSAAYLGQYGIRVNAVSPGGFERGQPEEFVKAYAEKTMLGRMGIDGSDLGGVIVFLASDAAAYITGHNLVVDGGFTKFR